MTEEITWIKISDLTPSSRSVNLKFKAIKHNEMREVTSRKDNSEHRVTEVLVGDDSGVVFMTLWDDSIERIEDEKTYILLNNYI